MSQASEANTESTDDEPSEPSSEDPTRDPGAVEEDGATPGVEPGLETPAHDDGATEDAPSASLAAALPEAASTPPKGAKAAVESPSETLASLEVPFTSGDWVRVRESLTAQGAVDELPPELALLFAIASAEEDREKSATEANFVAIRAMAQLLGVPESSPLAIQLAKRVMRRSPLEWHRREAPRARTRLLLVGVALLLGLVAGWVAPDGGVQWSEVVDAIFH